MKTLLNFMLAAAVMLLVSTSNFAQAPNLGTAADFVLFSKNGAVSNTGLSHLTGHVGTNLGACTNFGNINGNIHPPNPITAAAATDLQLAYGELQATAAQFALVSPFGHGDTLIAGVYELGAASNFTGSLVLDAAHDPEAVFIIRVIGALSVASGTQLNLINGAQACKVFWQVEGLLSIATTAVLRGTFIVNNAAIDVSANSSIEGRLLTTTGAITVNTIFAYTPIGCGSPALTGPTVPTLGAVGCFGIFSSVGEVANAGSTYVTGDVGTQSGTATGFDALNITGILHEVPDSATAAAATDLGNAFAILNAQAHDIELMAPASFGHSLVLTPQIYLLNAMTVLTDTLFLDAMGDSNAVFLLKINGALNTSTYAKVALRNQARAKNVFWIVNGAVAIHDHSEFIGTVIANNAAVDAKVGVEVLGRLLTTAGAISTATIKVVSPTTCLPPDPVVITSEPISLQVCEGDTALFVVVASGNGLSYQWYRGNVALSNGTGISGATSDSLFIFPAALAHAGNYTVIVADTLTSDTSQIATLTVLAKTLISTEPVSVVVCEGDTAVFSVVAQGDSLTYQWFKGVTAIANGVGISGATAAQLMLGSVSLSDAGTDYFVVVTGSCGLPDTSVMVTLTVNTGAEITLQPLDQILCEGDTLNLSVQATGSGLNYQWYKGNLLITGANMADLQITGVSTLDAANYFVIITGDCGAPDTSVLANVQINTGAEITLQPLDQILCEGDTLNLSVQATGSGLNYQWYKGNILITGANMADLQITGVSTLDAANYFVIITGDCGVPDTSVLANLQINTGAEITLQPLDQILCEGDTLNLSIQATGSGLNYQWYKGNVAILGATTSELMIAGFTITDAANYFVIVTGDCGAPDTSVLANVQINTGAEITLQPLDQILCEGDTLNLSVQATGSGLNYQWYKGNILITGANMADLQITGVSTLDAANYSVIVTGDCGAPDTSDLANVQINTGAEITLQPLDQILCEGDTLNLSVQATGSGLNYQWYKGNILITGANMADLQITGVSTLDAANYFVIITGDCGAPDTSVLANVQINTGAEITLQPLDQILCEGDTLNLSVQATGSNLIYQWYKGSLAIFGATTSELMIAGVTINDAANYFVIVTGDCGSPDTSVLANVQINTGAEITLQPIDQILCEGDTLNLSVQATGSGLNYQWYKGNILITGANMADLQITGVSTLDAANYFVIITGDCGAPDTSVLANVQINTGAEITLQPLDQILCEGDTLNLSVQATGSGLNYQWYKGNILITGANMADLQITGVSTLDAANYFVIITGDCGAPDTSVLANVQINTGAEITLQPIDQILCEGDTLNLSVQATGSGLNYQWYKGNLLITGANMADLQITGVSTLDAANYFVIITGDCGAPDTSVLANVQINIGAEITLQPLDQILCEGDTLNLSVQATGSGLNYQWYKGNLLITGTNMADLQITGVSTLDAANYSVIVTGDCGAPDTSDLANVQINTGAEITLQPLDQILCEGDTLNLSVQATGSGLNYQWYKGNILITGANMADLQITGVSTLDAANYFVIITGDCGAPDTSVLANVQINTGAEITLQPLDQILCEGDTLNLSVQATGSNLIYQWYKGSLAIFGATTSELMIAGVTINDAANYFVIVTGDCGAPDTSVLANVQINTGTEITMQPLDQILCEGDTLNLSVQATGSGLNYQWYKGNILITGANMADLQITGVSTLDAANYFVIITGDCGVPDTSVLANLQINTGAEITLQLLDQILCEGDTLNLSVLATGSNLNYQWYKGNAAIFGASTSELIIAGVLTLDAANYSVIATGDCGAPDTSVLANVQINTGAEITLQPLDQILCEGDTLNLSVQATGSGLTYQWYKGNAVIFGATTSELMIAGVSTLDAANYFVIITGDCGAPDTSVLANVQINTGAEITLQPLDQILCEGDTLNLSVQATGSGLNYQWYKGNLLITGANMADLQIIGVSTLDAANYSVIATGDCGAPDTSVLANVQINTGAEITLQSLDQILCEGDTLNLSVQATGSGLNYQWYKGSAAIFGATTSELMIAGVGINDAANYFVIVTGDCGAPDTSVLAIVQINTGAEITLQPLNQILCEGDTLNLSVQATGSGLNYQWYKGNILITGANMADLQITGVSTLDAANYFVIITGDCGAPDTSVLANVQINTGAEITLQPLDQILCEGDTLNLSVLSTGSNLNYQWYKGNAAIFGASTSELMIAGVSTLDAANYFVIITGDCGAPDTSVLANVQINTGAEITLQPIDQILCEGDTLNLSVQATGSGLNYQWYKGNLLITGANMPELQILGVSTADAANYFVIITGDCGAPDTSVLAIVQINTGAEITLQPLNQILCEGDTLNLSVQATGSGLNYQWYKGNILITGANMADLQITGVSTLDAANYFVIITGDCGAPDTSVLANVQINTGAEITLQPLDQILCEGDTLNLSVQATGSGLNYQWYKGNLLITGANMADLQIIGVSTLDAANYFVIITGDCGAPDTSVLANVQINTGAEITLQPLDQILCEGDTLNLSVQATGSNLIYQWYKGSLAIFGATTSELMIAGVTINDAANYLVIVTGDCGAPDTSVLANVQINTGAEITLQPLDQILCEGDTLNLSVQATGSGLNYQWYKGSAAIFGATTSELMIAGVSTLDAANYFVIITGDCGAPDTSVLANVQINTGADITLQPLDQILCEGDTLNLSVQATGSNLTYQWFKGNLLITGANMPELQILGVSTADAANYFVIITGDCGAPDTSVLANVQTNTGADITLQPIGQILCEGDTLNLSIQATGSGLNYQWYKGNVSILGATTSELMIAGFTITDAANYFVIITGDCGAPDTSVLANVQINTGAEITLQPLDQILCEGDTLNLSVQATGSGLNYQWYKGNLLITGANMADLQIIGVSTLDAANYFVIITGDCGAPDTSVLANVQINTGAEITLQPLDQILCEGDTLNLSVQATGSNLIYQWYKGSLAIFGATTSELMIAGVTINDAANYFVIVTGDCGAPDTSVLANVQINTGTEITMQPLDQILCEGDTLNLSVQATGSGLSYQWYKGNILITGANMADLQITGVSTLDAANYFVIITGDCGAPDTSILANVQINTGADITLQPIGQILCEGDTLNLSIQATGSGLNYQWYKGNVAILGATTSELMIAGFTITDAANYFVIVTGDCGAPDTSVLANVQTNTGAEITLQPLDQILCEGDTLNLSVQATGSGLSYQWYKGNLLITGANMADLQIIGVSTLDAANYFVIVTGDCGAPDTSVLANVQINTGAEITLQPLDQILCEGDTLNLSVLATGSGLTYQWYKGNAVIFGAAAANLQIIGVSTLDAANYFVIVTGDCGAPDTSVSVAIQINMGILITTEPIAQTVCAGQAVNLTVIAQGAGLTYQWRIGSTNLTNGGLISGATTATLTISAATLANAASNYNVIVSGSCGSPDTSVSVAVVVNSSPAITTQPLVQTLCVGANATFTVVATGTALTYQWRKGLVNLTNTGNVSGATTATLTLTGVSLTDAAADYNVLISGTCTPALASANVALQVNSLVAITTAPLATQTVCAGSSVSFAVVATGTGLTYQWRRGTTNLTNTGNVTGATSAMLTLNPVVAGDAATNYNVVIVGACAPQQISTNAALVVNALTAITTQPMNINACEGDMVSFSSVSVGTTLSYQWFKGGIALSNAGNISGSNTNTLVINPVTTADIATNYQLVVTGSCLPAVSSNLVGLSVGLPHEIVTQPSDTITYIGGSASFTVVDNGQGLTYQWRRGSTNVVEGGNIIGSQSATLQFSPATVADNDMNYNVVISGPCAADVRSINVALLVAEPLGIEEWMAKETPVVFYPNPFNTELNAMIQSSSSLTEADVQLYNSLGVLVMQSSLTNEQGMREQMTLPAGIYHYRVVSKGKLIQSGKLIGTH